MNIQLNPGKYVVAVSGGVDSIVLLDLLSKLPGVNLVVAHFDHGMRADSKADALLVAEVAKHYGFPYEFGYSQLGSAASEDAARTARYKFLNQIAKKYHAAAIVTAHHQDDLLETAIINLLRGTGWRGITAIKNNPKVLRPLLPHSKADILAYAQKQSLKWHEDSSNQELRFLRNLVRHKLLPKLDDTQKAKLIGLTENISKSGKQIEEEAKSLHQLLTNSRSINRQLYSQLPAAISKELLLSWLKESGVSDLDRPMIERLDVAVKSAKAGTTHEIKGGHRLEVTKETARLL